MPGEREPAARAIDVLIWLADHAGDNTGDSWGVRQVAREMNTSPSTIYRIFQVFESRDLVTKNEDGRYTTGLELFRICQVFSQRLSPVRIAKPHLEKLALACGETVLLAAYGARRGQMIVIDIIDAPHPLRWVVRLNQWNAIHSGATGLAILAFLPEEERRALYQKDLERFTERTMVAADELEAERPAGSAPAATRTPAASGRAARSASARPCSTPRATCSATCASRSPRAASTPPRSRSWAASSSRPPPISPPTCAAPASSATPSALRVPLGGLWPAQRHTGAAAQAVPL